MVTQRLAAQSFRGLLSRAAGANRSGRTASLNSPGTTSAESAQKQICGNESTLTLQLGARGEDNRKREQGTRRRHLPHPNPSCVTISAPKSANSGYLTKVLLEPERPR